MRTTSGLEVLIQAMTEVEEIQTRLMKRMPKVNLEVDLKDVHPHLVKLLRQLGTREAELDVLVIREQSHLLVL
jgi:hypothetical protein